MRTTRHIVAIGVAAGLLALIAPAAASADYHAVIRDCTQDGQLDHHYSQHELDQARHHIPSDVDEYTDCRSAIDSALARGNGRGGGGGGSAPYNPSLTTPAGATAYNQNDFNSYKSTTKSNRKLKSPPRVSVGGGDIPAGGGRSALLTSSTAANSIPSPVLGSLIAVGLLTLAATALLVARRWPGVRRVALRLFRH
jgi:hypothetical protein